MAFDTNVFSVIAVTRAMLHLLDGGPATRIVNVVSPGGSLTLDEDPTPSIA